MLLAYKAKGMINYKINIVFKELYMTELVT